MVMVTVNDLTTGLQCTGRGTGDVGFVLVRSVGR